MNSQIRLGLCCINTVLKDGKIPIYCSRSIQRKAFSEKGEEEAKQRAIENVKDLYKMIEWNNENGIKVLRVSSEMFPRAVDEKCGYTIEFAKEELKKAGDLAKKYKHRLTFHPGQYNVVGTPNEKAFNATVKELSLHDEIFKYMGFQEEKDSVIVIHGGGVYGDKEETIKRWVANFGRLPKEVQNKLVLENCEKSYSIRDCLNISKKIEEKYGFALPVVVDSHHYQCYNYYHKEIQQESLEVLLEEASKTWQKRGIRMKCHVSEQGAGQVGHHSDYISELPQEFLNLPKKIGIELDILIEAKMKEQAIFFLYEQYPFLDIRSKEAKKRHESYQYKQVSIEDLKKELKDRLKSNGNDIKKSDKDIESCCDDEDECKDNNQSKKPNEKKDEIIKNKKKITQPQLKNNEINKKNVNQSIGCQESTEGDKIKNKQKKVSDKLENSSSEESELNKDNSKLEKSGRILRSGNRYDSSKAQKKVDTQDEDIKYEKNLNIKQQNSIQKEINLDTFNFQRKKNKNLKKLPQQLLID